MEKYGYVVVIPDGPGGDKATHEGALANCERCSQPFQVSSTKDIDECFYHWGRRYSKVVNGEICLVHQVDSCDSYCPQVRRHEYTVAVQRMYPRVRDVREVPTSSMNRGPSNSIPDIPSLLLNPHLHLQKGMWTLPWR
jgi:hypothetical protein